MKCSICGKEGFVERRITRSFGQGEGLFLIENLPVLQCPHCGSETLAADSVRRIEEIRKNRDQSTQLRQIPVAVF